MLYKFYIEQATPYLPIVSIELPLWLCSGYTKFIKSLNYSFPGPWIVAV